MQDHGGDHGSNVVILLCFLSCVPIFALDIAIPRGYADTVLYLIPIVVITLYGRMRTPLLLMGVVTTALTITGFYFSSPGAESTSVIDGAFTIFVIIVAVIFGQFLSQAGRRSQTDQSLPPGKQ